MFEYFQQARRYVIFTWRCFVGIFPKYTRYTVSHMFAQLLLWAGNQDNHQNFDPSLLLKTLGLIFIGLKQKNLFFEKKNPKMAADSKKRPENPKNAFLPVFELTYVGQSYDHISWAISMPFASINPKNPRTNPWNFWKKILRIGGFEKLSFFESAIHIGTSY